MEDRARLTEMQRYIANVAITPSALRNLGEAGFVRAAQKFLAGIDLTPLRTMDPAAYPHWLECTTQELMRGFPRPIWGPARKSLNIFMAMAWLNRFLCTAYALGRLDDVLEVPLDNRVATELLKWAKGADPLPIEIPRWKTIKELDPGDSKKFQKLAAGRAREMGIPRARLDVALWPNTD